MPHKLRKIRKERGSRTQGYGRVGQHRCHGSKGYRKAGRHKAGWSYVLRYEPEYFSKKGFFSPKSLKKHERIINLRKLDEIAGTVSTETKEGKSLIDLGKLGYTKLLGKGKVTRPFIVRISSCSSSAAEKIKEAGGEILMKTREQGE
jgi:large subunit ribosomal protein L15